MDQLTPEEIKQINTYYENINIINGMKDLLYNYGYQYTDRNGWYHDDANRISSADRKLVENVINKLNILIKQNDKLKKAINIEL